MSAKKIIIKKDWVSNFTLVGKPIINDYTFKIDERSNKSNWIYNALNLGIDCSDKYGTVFCECMGGYSEDNENRIYAHGKKEDGSDDFEKQIIVDFDDRFNDDVLKEIGDLSFIKVGLELTDKKNVYEKKFLSIYDAIAYMKEHLTNDMVVVVRGNLKYSEYNGNVQVKKNVTSITLPMDRNRKFRTVTSDEYRATFTQSVLLDKDSAGFKNIDKNKSVMYIDAKVLDYVKEINGIEVKGQYPYDKQFEFELNLENEKQCKAVYEKLFKVKKGITQVTFEGEFIESGAVVSTTYEDLNDDIKELVDIGVYTLDEALAKCTANGSKERRMVLRKPLIKMVGDDDNKVAVVQKFEERYQEEDIVLDYLHKNNDADYPDDEETPFDSNNDNNMDWLNAL